MENSQNPERRLKIQPKYSPRQIGEAVFPEIKLSGKWLQKLGFTCGREVRIVQENGSLVISLVAEVEAREEKVENSSLPPKIDQVPMDELFRLWEAEEVYGWMGWGKSSLNERF